MENLERIILTLNPMIKQLISLDSDEENLKEYDLFIDQINDAKTIENLDKILERFISFIEDILLTNSYYWENERRLNYKLSVETIKTFKMFWVK